MNSTNSGGFKTFATLMLILIIWVIASWVKETQTSELPTLAEWTAFVNYPYEDINDAVAPSIRALADYYGLTVAELLNALTAECTDRVNHCGLSFYD